MKIKLVDYYENPEDCEVTFGTCEVCFSQGYAAEPAYTFETDTGKRFTVYNFDWSWGDYEEYPGPSNIADFAAFIQRQEFDYKTIKEANADDWFREQVDKYEKEASHAL